MLTVHRVRVNAELISGISYDQRPVMIHVSAIRWIHTLVPEANPVISLSRPIHTACEEDSRATCQVALRGYIIQRIGAALTTFKKLSKLSRPAKYYPVYSVQNKWLSHALGTVKFSGKKRALSREIGK